MIKCTARAPVKGPSGRGFAPADRAPWLGSPQPEVAHAELDVEILRASTHGFHRDNELPGDFPDRLGRFRAAAARPAPVRRVVRSSPGHRAPTSGLSAAAKSRRTSVGETLFHCGSKQRRHGWTLIHQDPDVASGFGQHQRVSSGASQAGMSPCARSATHARCTRLCSTKIAMTLPVPVLALLGPVSTAAEN